MEKAQVVLNGLLTKRKKKRSKEVLNGHTKLAVDNWTLGHATRF